MSDRGEHYADGGYEAFDRVFYPDAERMREIDREWEATFTSYRHIWCDKDGWHVEDVLP